MLKNQHTILIIDYHDKLVFLHLSNQRALRWVTCGRVEDVLITPSRTTITSSGLKHQDTIEYQLCLFEDKHVLMFMNPQSRMIVGINTPWRCEIVYGYLQSYKLSKRIFGYNQLGRGSGTQGILLEMTIDVGCRDDMPSSIGMVSWI